MARINEWRNSALPVRLFVVDALAAIPLFLAIVHLRVWTVALAFVWLLAFGILSRLGYRPLVALRILRTMVAGRVSSGRPWWSRPQERYPESK